MHSIKGIAPCGKTWGLRKEQASVETWIAQGNYTMRKETKTMARRKSNGKFDIYKMVTDRVIALMVESGEIPWEKPWVGGSGAWNRKTGKNYSFLNTLMLGEAGEYATFKQIEEDGGRLLVDENGNRPKARQVVYWDMLKVKETDENGEEVEKTVPFLKYSNVWNVETETNLTRKHHKDEVANEVHAIDGLERIKNGYLERSHVLFEERYGDQAYYAPMIDKVVVPKKEQFEDESVYYSTVFHELGHSTGHASRLGRIKADEVAAFGGDDYSREELVAELTSCAVLANTGVETSNSFRRNTAYIQKWVEALKADNKMIVWATSRAEKAYNMIMGIEDASADE